MVHKFLEILDKVSRGDSSIQAKFGLIELKGNFYRNMTNIGLVRCRTDSVKVSVLIAKFQIRYIVCNWYAISK